MRSSAGEVVEKTKGNEGDKLNLMAWHSRGTAYQIPKFDGAKPHADTHGGHADEMKESDRQLIVIMSPRHRTDETECPARSEWALIPSQVLPVGSYKMTPARRKGQGRETG